MPINITPPWIKLTGLFCLCFTLSSCMSTQPQDDILSAQQNGNMSAAAEQSQHYAEHNRGPDRLLWQLESGSSAFWNQQHDLSINSFRRAEEMITELDERAVINLRDSATHLASLLWNDTIKDYRGTPNDRLSLHTYQALNYLILNNLSAAKVELRKGREKRKSMMEHYEKELQRAIKKKRGNTILHQQIIQKVDSVYGIEGGSEIYKNFTNPFNVLIEGWVFYHGASDFSEKQHGEKLLNTLKAMMKWHDKSSPNPFQSKGLVIAERGIAPAIISRDISIPLLWHGKLTHAHLSFPLLARPQLGSFDLKTNGEHHFQKLLDTQSLMAVDFAKRMPSTILHRLSSAAIKAVAEVEMAKENQWLGLATSLLNTINNRSDTRSWRSYPAEVWVQDLTISHNKELNIDSNGRRQNIPSKNNDVSPQLLLIKHFSDNAPIVIPITLPAP